MILEILKTKPTQTVAVVVPIYKTELSHHEKISLARCLQILKHHPIIIIAPQGISCINYRFTKAEVEFEFFPKFYFESISGYNKLMLSMEFYRRFLNYKYILIYQLDAFIFRDDLLKWCNKEFDYVGAPWFDKTLIKYWSRNLSLSRIILSRCKINLEQRVGNGGFSLRKVKFFILSLFLLNLQSSNWARKKGFSNEDLFWSYYVTSYLPFFKIANDYEAINFSFEYYPYRCYELNHNQLPFGCHAWNKPSTINFWRPFFKLYGYVI